MEEDDTQDIYFTYEGRLASFKSSHPAGRRPSNAKGKASKATGWPHKELDPKNFASAGFYFEPTPQAPDNTICFLCLKSIAGWEENDSPVEEHLRLSPHCGWAIVAAIDASLGDYALDDPCERGMVEARKATFGGRWPHEGKRGWKCKTKQLVDAGWKYTPTAESDDMATCTYCSLALDGWEPKDNPFDEHYRRSPGCHFFELMNHYKSGPGKKKGKGKGARASQSSRLSAQSIATTAASDATSFLEHHGDYDDSIMTTTSVMTQGGTKRPRAKKGTTAKGKKARAKKEEAVEVLEDEPEVPEEQLPPALPKPTRGRKRASDTIDDSVLTATEAPAAKKRATRTRKTDNVESSMVQELDQDMDDVKPAPKSKTKAKKGRATTTRGKRKGSTASTVSNTSFHDEDAAAMVDDEELNRQLEADLDRPLSDDENIAADSDSDRKKIPAKSKGKKVATKKAVDVDDDQQNDDRAMFDPAPPKIDEDAVNAELTALEIEMEVERAEIQAETHPAPKKGRKAGTKKAPKQTKKVKEPEPVQPEPEPESEAQPNIETAAFDELAEGHDMSIISNGTLVRASLSSNAAPKKRGRPSKKATMVNSDTHSDELADSDTRAQPTSQIKRASLGETGKKMVVKMTARPPPAAPSSPATDNPIPAALDELDQSQPPSTPPRAAISPAPAAKQAAISPSPTPQSSDAENEPPSSKPSTTTTSSRVALAPVAVTPVRTSPSKRNILAGLQSSVPWAAVDVDMIFENLDKENSLAPAKSLRGGADLTSPEKVMTVEEWIYYNAEDAEKKLKHECEAMVTTFEREGTKAMQALEGLLLE